MKEGLMDVINDNRDNRDNGFLFLKPILRLSLLSLLSFF